MPSKKKSRQWKVRFPKRILKGGKLFRYEHKINGAGEGLLVTFRNGDKYTIFVGCNSYSMSRCFTRSRSDYPNLSLTPSRIAFSTSGYKSGFILSFKEGFSVWGPPERG